MRFILGSSLVVTAWLVACGEPPGPPEQSPPIESIPPAAPATNNTPVTPDIEPGGGGFEVKPGGGVHVAAVPGVTMEELATTETGEDGFTPEYSIEISAQDDALMLAAVGPASHLNVQIQGLKNPDGVLLADGPDHFTHKSRSVMAQGTQATLLPESPDYASLFVPGQYAFKVHAAAATGPIRIVAFKKPKAPTGARHVLDVNLFFTGAAGVDASAARENTRLQSALTELRNMYSAAGIEIGEVRYFDTPTGFDAVTGMVPSPATTGTTSTSAAELLRLSSGAPTGLNFFFVEVLDPFGFGAFFPVLGVAGGIPGPTLLTGTDRSGVIVLFDSATWEPKTIGGQQVENDFLGTVMAHEGGHFLGLSHTYEAFGGRSDNISDTPAMTAANANDYLMQPSALSNGGVVSPLQAITLRRNPLVRTRP